MSQQITVPPGWARATVGELGQYINGLAFKPSDWETNGRPIIRIQNLTRTNSEFNYTTRQVPEAYVVHPSDILVSWSATLDAFRWFGPEAVLNQHIFRVVPNKEVADPGFLFWGLKHVIREMWKSEHTHGSTMKHINRGPFLAHSFALPPINEQHRIVAKIEELTTRSSRAREALDTVPALLDRFRQSVLAAAFRGDLTAQWQKENQYETIADTVQRVRLPRPKRATEDPPSISGKYAIRVGDIEMSTPEGWQWVRLTDVARLESGHTPSRSQEGYWNGDIPWIGIRDANDHHGKVIQGTLQAVTQAGIDNSAARVLPAGTVCLSRTASVGYVCIMGQPMATSQDFVNWVCTEALVPKFLMYLLLSEGDHIRRFGKGSTHTTIYFPEVLAFQVCLPSVAEQHQVVREIELRLERITAIQKIVETAQAPLSRLNSAILTKAFRGELVPQDPNDEPASVMLERLRAQQAEAVVPKAKRGRKPREKAEATV